MYKDGFRGTQAALLGIFVLYVFMFIMGRANAAPFQEIPDGLNHALFGGANLYAAKLILSGAILASIGLAMAGTKINFLATLVVMITALSILVAIGWLDFWIIIVLVLVVVSLFGKTMVTWVTQDSGSGGN